MLRSRRVDRSFDGCRGASILRVATTASRYAALAHGGIVLGDLADTPDLP